MGLGPSNIGKTDGDFASLFAGSAQEMGDHFEMECIPYLLQKNGTQSIFLLI
jgi:hypothetical protein